MTEITLLEPSVADAIKATQGATDLTASERVHWPCSLRQICFYLDKPPETVPARWKAICITVHSLHHARVGATPKTLANHKSNARGSSPVVRQCRELLQGWHSAAASLGDAQRKDQGSQSLQAAVGFSALLLRQGAWARKDQ